MKPAVRKMIECACLCAVAATAVAQNYNIDWHAIKGGGGTSSGGTFTLSGTIGQHDAGGPMTGGTYSVTGGYWSLISVVQTAGAPSLFISHSGSQVMVYWQGTGNWTLQQNNNLEVPGGWTASAGVVSANGTNSLTMSNPPGAMFFRLKQ